MVALRDGAGAPRAGNRCTASAMDLGLPMIQVICTLPGGTGPPQADIPRTRAVGCGFRVRAAATNASLAGTGAPWVSTTRPRVLVHPRVLACPRVLLANELLVLQAVAADPEGAGAERVDSQRRQSLDTGSVVLKHLGDRQAIGKLCYLNFVRALGRVPTREAKPGIPCDHFRGSLHPYFDVCRVGNHECLCDLDWCLQDAMQHAKVGPLHVCGGRAIEEEGLASRRKLLEERFGGHLIIVSL
mmetsp:Transcript_82163/g.255128  ORF Transcript_82163/g.255128 Transcript_82163/m.255128 type:complete len:243 (+) Transcript_82163:381-1109(+)